MDEIYEISGWATGGLLPNLVFFMNVDARTALGRLGSEPDRIESETHDFHERVGTAYTELAAKFADRFVVLDASRTPAEIHQDVVKAVQERAQDRLESERDTDEMLPAVPR